MINSFDRINKLAFFRKHEVFAAFIVFVLLSIFSLHANPFSDETVAPFDRLLEFPGWAIIQSDRKAVHAERSDILDSQLPAWITLKNQIRRGENPLWYPNGAGGQPISLEICNPAFLLFVAIKDNALAYYFVGLVKLVISGFGVYLLLRIFLRWLPSVWGGIVFMLCGFNSAWFFWEHVTTSMWIPWLLWATVMYLKTKDKKWLPAITLTALLLIFGGFPSVAAFGFYSFALLIVFWNVYDAFSKRASQPHSNIIILKLIFQRTALPLMAVGIAFLMSAITIIPFRESMSGVNLNYRTGGTLFSIDDLRLFLFYEDPPKVERTAYLGIPVMILSLIGIFSAFRCNNEKRRIFIFFNLLLATLTTLIAFGLLPHHLIRALPVFKSNIWSRLIVVTLLALSALSAVGLDLIYTKLQGLSGRYLRLTPLHAQRIVAVVLIGLIALQFQSQKKLFNRFNAVVPAAWFYPLTPSIKYVKEHLAPLQSVIASSAYWFAGTLGAYGIPEWYAHSFRSDAEKNVLRKLVNYPFSSATSAKIFSFNINMNSPLMEKLAIKYLLLNKEWLEEKRVFSIPGPYSDLAPPLPYNAWRQHIYIPDDMNVGAIGFLFATGGEEHAPANARLSIYRDSGEKYPIEAELRKDEITGNHMGYFMFPDRVFLRNGGYYLTLSLPDYSGPKNLTAWATNTHANFDSFLEVNGTKTDYSLMWEIGYFQRMDLSLLEKKWAAIDLGTNIIILENKQTTNSAYFVEDINASNGRIDYSGLDVKKVSVDRIFIENLKEDAGWIVLPMSLDSGWKAYVDGRRVKYDAYLGMLPAIPVKGPGQLIFTYEPESFREGAIVSLAGVSIFLIFSGLSLRNTRKKP